MSDKTNALRDQLDAPTRNVFDTFLDDPSKPNFFQDWIEEVTTHNLPIAPTDTGDEADAAQDNTDVQPPRPNPEWKLVLDLWRAGKPYKTMTLKIYGDDPDDIQQQVHDTLRDLIPTYTPIAMSKSP